MIKAYSYIRFSSIIQERGDSLRRQSDLAERYSKKHNLTLDKELDLKDLGKSAYHAKHKTEGQLGVFLLLIIEGKIEKGSYLLIEDLDRLSREHPFDALGNIQIIINAGINIVTLNDNQLYSRESITQNTSQIFVLMAQMIRANDESVKKSKRIGEAWEQKRKDLVKGKKLTGKIPIWLELVDNEFKIIPKAVKAIEVLFTLKLQGKSKATIMKELNTIKNIWKPPVRTNVNKDTGEIEKISSGGWRESYIQKTLNNRAVLGEFQPHKFINGKREPIGELLTDYFPQIISDELYYKVQSLMAQNRLLSKTSGGQTGKAYNLFVNLVKCGECGSAMHYINKGSSSKGGQYLYCDNMRRKLGCTAKHVRYYEFEQLFFDNFEELQASNILPNADKQQIEVLSLENDLKAYETKLKELDSRIENTSRTITNTKDNRVREMFEKTIITLLNNKELTSKQHKETETTLIQLKSSSEVLQNALDTTKEVYATLQALESETKKIDMRLRLRTEIRRIVSIIQIYPLKEPYKKYKEVDLDIIQIMQSKYIDKVRIRFVGNKNSRVLYKKTYIDLSEPIN